jgi:D-alanyl-D-alanine endopeptidase (penicillin-binding protein 7)
MFKTTLGRISILVVMAVTFSFGILLIAVWSVDDALRYEPSLKIGIIDATKPSAAAFMVFDVESGTEIASKNSTEALPIASVTKLVTASVFYAAAPLEATTTITWPDLNTYGDAGRLKIHEEYTYRGLLYPLLLESSNDAAAAMLRVMPTLLPKMEEWIKVLSLTQTHFEDTSGLSDKNVSTAYELSILARALYQKEPHIFDITSLTQFIGPHTGWMNNNPLVAEEGFMGGKHGYTEAANKTAVVFFNEKLATGHMRTIGYVLLGSNNLKEDVSFLRAEVQKNVRFE